MVEKLNDLFIAANVMWSHFVEDFKNDESGLSGVVVAVLLIVISVIAVLGIWGALNGQLKSWWDNVTGSSIDPAKVNGTPG